MSSTWLATYSSAVSIRDAYEKANEPLINAYTTLADQTASISGATSATTAIATAAALPDAITARNASSKPPAIPPPILSRTSTPLSHRSPSPSQTDTTSAANIAQIRADLGAANRARADLASALASLQSRLDHTQESLTATTSALNTLTRQKAVLERRLRDRDSELVERRKLLERVQDEMVGLEMQVNVAEEEKKRVRLENEDLVRRLVRERERIVAERVRVEEGGV